MSPWIALILYATTGLLSANIQVLTQLPMQSREACLRFQQTGVKTMSHQFGIICVSTETGEIISKIGVNEQQ